MSSISIRDQRLAGVTMLPDDFIDYYMPRANGDFVKIYLYLLRSVHAPSAAPTISSLADVFRLTERDVDRALRYWQEAGLLDLKYKAEELDEITLLPVSQKLHETQKDPVLEQPAAMEETAGSSVQISSARMKELKAGDRTREEVRNILYVAHQYLGHPLSQTDMRRLLYLYDDLRMSAELIDYLVDYCVSRGSSSMHYIMKVGLAWHDEGITTVKDAKARNNLSMKNYYTIFRAFGITGRSPVPGEIADMDRWMKEYGFSVKIIEEAAARTIRSTGKPSFPYAERILSDWRTAGVRRPADIAALDERHKAVLKDQKTAQKAPSSVSGTAGKQSAGRFGNFPQRNDEEHRRLIQEVINQQ